jgi:hypothetical protein
LKGWSLALLFLCGFASNIVAETLRLPDQRFIDKTKAILNRLHVIRAGAALNTLNTSVCAI